MNISAGNHAPALRATQARSSAQEKALAQRIPRVERELGGARAVGAALHLGHDRRAAGHLGVADDTREELRVDDREMAKRLAAWQATRRLEEREAGRRAAPAGRTVDLAVGEDRDVPLRERLVVLVLPEDDAVDVPQF